LEVMQVEVQQRRASGGDATAQRLLDHVEVVEPARVVDVDDEMNAGAAHAVPDDEVIVARVRDDSSNRDRPMLLWGGTWDTQALPRSQEGVLAHAVLPNQRWEPEMLAGRRHAKRTPPDRFPATRPDQQRRPLI